MTLGSIQDRQDSDMAKRVRADAVRVQGSVESRKATQLR